MTLCKLYIICFANLCVCKLIRPDVHCQSHTTHIVITFLSVSLTNNIIHILSLAVAFLFNWIGFLLLMCFCHTIAARYGALSGFGLSLAKWTLIVKHSTELASRENSWLWWLIMAFGNITQVTNKCS